jgi:ribosomal protein S9
MATQYIQTIGRRKTSTARIRLTPGGKNSFVVNDKPVDEYFKTPVRVNDLWILLI